MLTFKLIADGDLKFVFPEKCEFEFGAESFLHLTFGFFGPAMKQVIEVFKRNFFDKFDLLGRSLDERKQLCSNDEKSV